MMKNKLLTKHCALTLLMALLAATWSTNAWAGIKIHVRTEGNASGTAPYLYVWNSTGEELNGEWSACKMSETTTTSDGQTWYVKEFNETNINAIIHNNLGGNDNQTPDLTGICEDRYYTYKGGNEYYNLTNQYVIPNNATYIDGNFVYFVNTSEWVKPCIWVYDNNNANYNTNSSWPGDEMTKVDGSVNLWVWQGTKSGTPTKIKFSNNGANETSALNYDNGGYYNTVEKITTITKLILNSTNFPDANFRSALATALNVNEGDEIYPNNVKVLDVSNKGITDLTGIANFTNLEELYAQDNSITSSSATSSNIDVGSNRKLRILNASNNSSLTHINGIANCSVLEELYLDGIDFWPSRQISTSTTANVLSATNNPSLKRLSIAGSALQSSFTLPSFPALEYLNLSDNSSFNGFSAAFNIPRLKTFKMSNSNLKSTAVMINCIKNSTGLEYLDLNTNALDSINLFKNTALTHLDLSHNNLSYLNLANQKELVTLNMSYNSKLYCTVNNNSLTNFPSTVTNNGYIYMKNLPKLEEADMSHCSIYRAGAGTQFEGLTSLKKLNLSYNYATHNGSYLASITTSDNNSCMQSLTALEELDLTGCSQLHMVQIDGLPLRVIKLEGTGLNTELLLTNNQLTNLNFPNETSLSTLTSLPSINVSGNPFSVLNIPQTPNSLLTITANDCSSMTKILAEHNASKLQYVTAHNCPALTDITINGADIYFNKQLNAFDATNKSNLETLDLSNDAMTTNYALDGFTALTTVDFSNNYMTGNENNISSFTAINCPSLTSVNLDGNANMETITLKSNGFSNSSYPVVTVDAEANNVTLDFSDNNFTAVPNIEATQINILKLNDNKLTDINIPDGCNVRYLYAQNNNFGGGEYTLPTTSLVGLDLGNNDFTKFKAENNTSLKSLALAGNDNLTEIELHGNTALTQTSPDGVIENDNGLYIKELSNLQTLNIENSSFSKLGQQNSLQGVTGLKTLKARHNNFTTFTNGVYTVGLSGTGNYRITDPTESSLEYLTALEYLDLAYNNLQDSVHLYKNVNLKHLDVSHNRTIVAGGIYTNPNMTQAEKTAMRERKGRHLMKYGKVLGKTYGVTPTETQWTKHYTNFQKRRSRPFDLRDCDLNDTTGLYHLDLGKNVNLEWLDFSYTNIHNTAAGPTYMCPGWMDKDWVTDIDDLSAVSSYNTQNQRAYVSWHTYVYFIPCSKLKVIHADHNNMRSLGYRYFPELDTLTCSYMYGDSEMMRDFNTIDNPAISDEDLRLGMGNTGTQTKIKKFKKVTWGTNNDNEVTGTVVLVGPNGSTSDNSDFYPNKLRYYDISYSSFNEIRFYPGTADNGSLPYLEYVNVSGNPLNFQVHPNSTVSNYNSLDLTYCPNIRTVLAENCADLPVVRAHNRTKLDTLYLSNDPNLKTLYVQNDPLLKTNFQGLNTLTGLETLFGYNNTHWGNDITFASNTALKNLWISNINASQLNVAANTALEKLRAYDNSLTALNLSGNANLLWLDVARNKLPEIDLSGNTKLQFFNISNGSDTRTQLDGTEQLNHDGSDGDAIKPTTIFSADEAPIANADAGNSLSDLALPASITDARANGNDLHSITGNFANLTNIEFAHNHINGITLPSSATVESRDNGRTITADCAKFTPHGDFGNVVTVYFFQLADLSQQEVQNGTQLTLKTSDDIKGDTRILGTDGLVLGNISWNQSNAGMLRNETTLNPGNMGDYLDPDEVPGSIVVLEAASETDNGAEGTATYTYDNGTSTPSEFYLNWSSDGTITGIGSVIDDNGFDLAGTYGGIVVAGKDGTVVGVYDLNGRQVASETITGGKALITGLTPGIYLVNGQKVLVK